MTCLRAIPDQETLRSLLDYDPQTGSLTWKERSPEMLTDAREQHRWNARYAGCPAFTFVNGGYLVGSLLKSQHRAHRVIWKWMTGKDPDIIDHINGVRTDNRWANLRSTDYAGNAWNTALPRNNTSGCVGVSWVKRQKRWVAHIKRRGEHLHLGFHRTFEDAVAARKAAEIQIGYHSNHGRAS
jgi:hypothetical protein